MGFAALNAAAHQGKQNRVRETLEAQESRKADTYAAGLKLAEEGRRSEALVVFEELLNETLTHRGGKAASTSAASASQLRYLVLRNLASLLAGEDASAPRALSLYAQALMLDDGDSVVWNHMGTLAAELGRWGVARTVFEHGLQQHPKHAVMAEKLVEVQVQLGDWEAAQPALARLIAKDPTHPRALQLHEAAKLARVGTILDLPASTFQKRSTALELPSLQPDGPVILSVSSPKWSALLHAVAAALTGSRQLQGQSVGLSLHGMEIKLPPEQSSGVLTKGNEGRVDIMEIDSGPLATQLQEQPEHAKQSLVVGNGFPQADNAGTSATALATQLAAQASMQQKEPQHAAEKGGYEAGRPPPARVSRRLEARREGHHPDTDDAGGEEEVNIMAELQPFLQHEPPLIGHRTSTAADAVDMDRDLKKAAQLGVQDAVAEEQAVRAFVRTNGRAASLHAAGVALLNVLPQVHHQRWTRDTAERALALASALGSTWRPEGEIALTLAELGLDAADAVAEGHAPPGPGRQKNMQPGNQVGSDTVSASSERKAKAAPKRKGAEQAAVAKLLAHSEEYLGRYLMSRILPDPEGLSMTDRFGQQSVRHLWVLARTAEMRRNFGIATKHYAACLKQLQDWQAQHQGSDCQSISLPHFSSGLVISTSVAQAKLDSLRSHQVMETAKANYDGGRPDLVIAELAPILYNEAGVAGKEPLSRPKSILEGLQVLQDAAIATKDASCELKCRLLALKWLLPPIPDHCCDNLALHSAPVSGPPPAIVGDLQKAFRSIAVEAMADLAEFVAVHTRAGDLAVLAASATELPGLLHHVQWQAAVLLEAAFWSLCGSHAQAAGHPRKTMNAKMTARQAALLAACMDFCVLHQLQLAGQPATIQSVALEEKMLAVTASYLARRDILDLQRGAFVRLALGCFSHSLSVLRGLTPDEEGAKEELGVRLKSNLARCLQLLFGVTLPDRNMEWGAAHGEVAENLGLQSKDECIEVWQHLKPYAESLEKDSKALGRLQGVLGAIQKHFMAPPASVLNAWDPAKLLDSLPFDRSDVYSSTNTDLVEQLLQQPGELHIAVAGDTHAAIHCSLHRLLDIIKPDIDAALKFGEGLSLDDRGAEVTASVASLAAYDLRYNPRSLRSWDSLANTYKEAASNILNEAAQAFSVGEFHEREDLQIRFATYQRRALWASLAARTVAAAAGMADDAAILDEQIGNILYEELQNAPPFSDQLSVAVETHTKTVLVQNAAQAYRKAWSGLPDEWLYACYSGKLQAKLGAPPEDWLSCMAKAVHLSVLHVGGLVEPFYQLHSLRLKLLLKAQPTLAQLRAISRYCSQESAADEAAAAFSGITPEGMNQVKRILIDDCTAAMRFCLESDKQYHKASYQIGRALAAQGRNEEAVQQLQSLFSARNRFSINIWEIRGGSQAKSPTPSEASAKDAMSADGDERLWSRQPGSMSGNGLDETYRKFAAARRKYMLLYFQLLQSTGRLDTLLAGHAFLQSTAWGSPAMMMDLARISLARCVVGAASRLMQHRAQIVDPSPLQPEQALGEHLQLCFTLCTEHLLGPEAGFSAADTLTILPETPPKEEQDAVVWALKEGFWLAAQRWIAFLGSRGAISRLHDLLCAVRKHFKMFKSAPEEVQALASLAAADMALAIDRRLSRLGAPPYAPGSSSAGARISETEDGSSLPRTSAAPDTPGQQPAPTALAAAPATAGSTAAPASSAAPSSSAVPAMGTAHHIMVLQRLDLSEALATTLAPHMPQILLHLLPGNDGERRVLQTLLLSGYDLGATLGPHLVQQLKSSVQRNATACMQLLSAATGQAGPSGSAAVPSAAVPAVSQVPSPSQPAAVHVSLAEAPRQSQESAVLLGDAQTADGSAASPKQGELIAEAAVHATQQPIAAAPDQRLPVTLGAGVGAAAASANLAVQTAPVPQQPQMAEEVIPESASPAAQGRQSMESSAERREEAFELMRFSRYLHKTGTSRLPERQDQTQALKEGLAKIDGNMVRAYLLYLKCAGLESKMDSSIRAADAATGYEELAKALKQASPAKAARGARERPGPGASADREEAGDAGTEAGPGQDGKELPAKRRRREPACT